MDQKTEAQRLKLYYEGFNHAGTPEHLQQLYPGFDDDRDDPDSGIVCRCLPLIWLYHGFDMALSQTSLQF